MRRITVTQFWWSLLAALQVWAQTDLFVGCANLRTRISGSTTPGNSGAYCVTACQGSGFDYAYYNGVDTCRCSNTDPTPNVVMGDINACPANSYDGRLIDSTPGYSFYGCLYQVTFRTFSRQTGTSNVKGCISACSSSTAVSFVPSSQECVCGTLVSYSSYSPCGPDANFYYSSTVPMSNTGTGAMVRRSQLQQKLMREREWAKLCPGDLTACRVFEEDDTEYECLDTSFELESCGGCIHGAVGGNTTLRGEDCTQQGAVLGGVTCLQGHCLASACEEGYYLDYDRCEAEVQDEW